MTHRLDLVCTAGPLAGSTINLDPKKSLTLGRKEGPNAIPDPQVSLRHCRIDWDQDSYFVTDLGSSTGTKVDGQELHREQSAMIAGGSRIRLGETEFSVEERVSWGPRILLGFAAAVAVVAVTLAVVLTAASPVVYSPHLRHPTPVHQGSSSSPVIKLPLSFVRSRGFDHRDITIKRVTDFDQNGIHEVWLDTPKNTEIITWTTEGALRELGTTKKDCQDRAIGTSLPDLKCGHAEYRYLDRAYRPYRMEGVVAWIPPEGEGWAPPVPKQLGMNKKPQLAGFLSERNIKEPIHYLICENDFVPGVSAQVLTSSGELKPLEPGCIGALGLEGEKVQAHFGDRRPVALAFTAVGHQALIDDLTVLVAGSLDALFIEERYEKVLETMSATPPASFIDKVVVRGPKNTDFKAIPRERTVNGTHKLLFGDDSSYKPPPSALTAQLLSPGKASLDPDGCSVLEVQTAAWNCSITKGCTSGTRFMTISQTGCGVDTPVELLRVPYDGGTVDGQDDNVQVRAVVKSISAGNQIDVVQARVGFRIPPEE